MTYLWVITKSKKFTALHILVWFPIEHFHPLSTIFSWKRFRDITNFRSFNIFGVVPTSLSISRVLIAKFGQEIKDNWACYIFLLQSFKSERVVYMLAIKFNFCNGFHVKQQKKKIYLFLIRKWQAFCFYLISDPFKVLNIRNITIQLRI